MRKFFILFINLFICLYSAGQTFVVDTLVYNGNPSNRINLLVLGDGYTSAQMSQFRSNALSVSNYLLSTPPFNMYPNFFNVFAIEVISNQSGNDHPGISSDGCGSQPITSVDNYLQSSFDGGPGGGGVHRCIYSNQISLIYSIANTNFPQYDYLNVLANTTYYGGCAGGVTFTSINSSASEVFVHEFGHSFGGLADEYAYGGSSCNPGTSQGINVSQQTDTSLLVWKKWLTTAPIPTPNGTNCSLIGLYEGAQYCATNWYRPKCNCKMQALGYPFCEVCKEQLIYKISTLVNYIDGYTPQSLNPAVCRNATQLFSANVLNSTNNTIRTQWFVDNNLVLNNSPNFIFDPANYSDGMHLVKVVTYDTTALVKKAMNSHQVVWNVNLSPILSVTTSQTSVACYGGNDGTATAIPSGGKTNFSFNLASETWEGNHSWSLVNGTQANKWFAGTATSNGGSKSIYISNNSSSNAYTITSASVVHFYKNFTFPANAVNIKVRFDWKGYGENANDYLSVFLIPTTTTPVSGTQLVSGQIGASNYNLQNTFITETISGLDANAGLTRRLVFSWTNNTTSGIQPPAAIDNIVVSYETIGAYSYLWNTTPFQTTVTANNLSAGQYLVTVTDVIGCSVTSDPVIINSLSASFTGYKLWDVRFGGSSGDALYSLQQTNDGGYILGGYSVSGISGDKTQASQGGTDYWIVKVNSNGVKQWDSRFGGSNNEFLQSLQQTNDGGYILGGYSASGISGDKTQASQGNNDFWIVKVDSDGTKQWDARYGGSSSDVLNSLCQTTDGGYVLGGYSASGISGDKTQVSQGGSDYWIVKVDSSGTKLWDARFGGSNNDFIQSLQQCIDGGYILGGYSASEISSDKSQASQGNHDYWIVKVDSSGIKQWDKSFGGASSDFFMSLNQTSDSGYILGGYSDSGISSDKSEDSKGGTDYWIIKVNSIGLKQWDAIFGGSDNDELISLQQTGGGEYILGGYSSSGISGDRTQVSQGLKDYWIVKVDSNGLKKWDARFGGSNDDFLRSLQQSSDGSYIIGGYSLSGISGDKTQASQGVTDFWVLKISTVPSITPDGPTSFCSGDSVMLTSSAGSSYLWNIGATTQSITVSDSGNYSVTVTDEIGCMVTSPAITTEINSCLVTLNLSAFIEGYYSGSGSMEPVLLNQSVAGVSGLETDTIYVELRSSLELSLIDTASVLLLTNGTATASFSNATVGESYWIVVKHRNSIQIWSSAPVVLDAVSTYSFSSSSSNTFGNKVKLVDTGIWALYTGDINQDEFIDIFDFPDYDSDNQNFIFFNYVSTDLNGDGFVDIFDFPIYDINNQNFIFSSHP